MSSWTARSSGSGCAISQASVDMMLDLIIGRSKEDALKLADLFSRMIKGEATGDELEPLGRSHVSGRHL